MGNKTTEEKTGVVHVDSTGWLAGESVIANRYPFIGQKGVIDSIEDDTAFVFFGFGYATVGFKQHELLPANRVIDVINPCN